MRHRDDEQLDDVDLREMEKSRRANRIKKNKGDKSKGDKWNDGGGSKPKGKGQKHDRRSEKAALRNAMREYR